MKKIKSVKLKNDELKKGVWGNWVFPNCDFPVFSEDQITGNPSAFEIEYEEETKTKITVEVKANFRNLDVHYLRTALDKYCHSAEFEVTELPEQFSREQLEDFAEWIDIEGKTMVNNWLSERIKL